MTTDTFPQNLICVFRKDGHIRKKKLQMHANICNNIQKSGKKCEKSKADAIQR